MSEYLRSLREYIGHACIIVPASGVFVLKDGKALLQKRLDDGKWSDHGGSLDIGETFEEAAKRELFEETGLTANRLEFMGLLSGREMLHTYPNGDRVYITAAYWLCEDFSGELLPESDETSELRWFGIDKLPENVTLPAAFRLFKNYISEKNLK
ncbi:MAG: NUDIX domain-containing protein [Oscillospiraceae bacterium]|jgi:8-oxo-dGTP pyrophosphatase MutT (NUDIX family)|nr:NUDIX domain-containing protein [Oscillospiraceae bacterium]